MSRNSWKVYILLHNNHNHIFINAGSELGLNPPPISLPASSGLGLTASAMVTGLGMGVGFKPIDLILGINYKVSLTI